MQRVAGGDESGDQRQPAPASLAVIPPDETTALDIRWTFGPVCESSHIDQLPFARG